MAMNKPRGAPVGRRAAGLWLGCLIVTAARKAGGALRQPKGLCPSGRLQRLPVSGLAWPPHRWMHCALRGLEEE
jgi:hypothetical protein